MKTEAVEETMQNTEQKMADTEAKQLIVDLYGCRTACIDDVDYIRDVVHQACERIGAGIVEECYHKFQPVGISAIAVITTSHLSIHTWPEFGYAAVDVFSCQEEIPGELCRLFADLFHAGQTETRIIRRTLLRGKEDIYGKHADTP